VCHHVFKYEERDKNTNFYIVHIVQTKGSIKYILNIYGGVMQSKKRLLLNKPNDKHVSFSVLC
jgi:hypothetical protein